MDEPQKSRFRRIARRALGLGFVLCVLPVALGIGIANVAATPAKAVRKSSPFAYEIGVAALHSGCYDQAEKYLRQVPPSHPEYSRAMRFVGYDVYCAEWEQPRAAIVYVNRALWSDPLDGNAWQDALRAYQLTLEDVLFGWLD